MAAKKTAAKIVQKSAPSPAKAAPRITAAAATLVADIDKVKGRIAKLAKRLDIPVPNTAADTAPTSSLSGAIAGAAAAVAAVQDLLNHIEASV